MAKITFLGAAGTVTGSKYLGSGGEAAIGGLRALSRLKGIEAAQLGSIADRSGNPRLGGAHACPH